MDILKIIIEHFFKSLKFRPKIPKGFKLKKRVLFFGLGGSGFGGEILKFLSKRIILVEKNYKFSFQQKLDDFSTIVCSWSGKTKPNQLVLNEIKKAKPLIVSSGDLANKFKNLPTIALPKNEFSPRFNLGYFISVFSFLEEKKLWRRLQKINTKKILKKVLEILDDKFSKDVILKIKKRIPLIYSSKENFPLAYLMKIKLNENSKIPAFCNFFPELAHNELSFLPRYSRKFLFVILKDKKEKFIEFQVEIFKKILKNSEIIEIILPEEKLEKLIFVNLFSDVLTYKISGSNIIKNKTLEVFKKSLGKYEGDKIQ